MLKYYRPKKKVFAFLDTFIVLVAGFFRKLPKWAYAICACGIISAVSLLIVLSSGSKSTYAQELPSSSPTQEIRLNTPPAQADEPVPTPTPDPTLKQGMDDPRVELIQGRLMELGYLDLDEPTQHFGPATAYAVQLFQRQHGLSIDGICGPSTLEKIFAGDAKHYTLLTGARGNDVESFQKRLKQLGYLSKVDGEYGSATTKAVSDFQKRNGLSVDGKAGQKTFDLIWSSKAKGAVPSVYAKGGKVDVLISTAKSMLGKKYILGREGPNSYDCSGLVYYCLVKAGVKTGRLNAAGYSDVDKWTKVSKFSDLKKGDLLFFRTNGKRIGHTGIYIGNGEMIDASSSNGKVVRRSCSTAFWKKAFVVGRRPWK